MEGCLPLGDWRNLWRWRLQCRACKFLEKMKNCLNLNFQEPFYSEGLLLNYHGTVYCPYVCNYPIHIRKSAKHVAPNREDRCYPRIGDWISFRAKFDPSTQRYEINEVNGVKMRKKFKYMKLPGEKDTYAVKFLKIFFLSFFSSKSLWNRITTSPRTSW